MSEKSTLGPLVGEEGPCSSSRDQSSPSTFVIQNGHVLRQEPPRTMITMEDDVYLLDGRGTYPVEKVTQDGGVLKSIVQQGQGPIVPLHAACLVHYTGKILSNGDIFMNTRDTRERGRGEPVHIVAGRDSIRKERGLHEVVGTMRVGEVCHAWVSPEYGYGDAGNFSFPSIPPKASLSYSIELIDFEEPISEDGHDARFLTYEERLEAAARRRLEGNAMYASGRLDEAMVKYESALAYLDDDFMMQLYEFHYDKAMEEKVHVLLNISACRLKQEQYHAVIEVISEVLSHDKTNVKGLYRRGVARRKLGQTAEALEDLEKAKSISEKLSDIDVGIVREIAAVRNDIKEQGKVQGVLYKAMMQSTAGTPPQKTLDVPENNRQQSTSSPPADSPGLFRRCMNWLISWTSYRCGHFNSSYSLITMGRNRSISRIGSLIRQATADVSGQAKASDTTTSSVVASVRTFSNNAKRTEASNITNTIRQALFRSSHGVASNPTSTMMTGKSPFTQVYRAISVEALKPGDVFAPRHNSITPEQQEEMAKLCGFESMDALVEATVPDSIKRHDGMPLGKYTDGMTESEFLDQFKKMASKNKVFKSFIGMGYHGTHIPTVIMRNLLENPGWYTQYTPYQAEIAQGRLESLLNFQTMMCDLTGMEMSNASLLDEATAAAEAMTMCSAIARGKKPRFLVSSKCHPQTIEVCKTRASALGLHVEVQEEGSFSMDKDVCGVMVQYPATDGSISDYKNLAQKAHDASIKVVVATDPLALTKLTPPGEWGADIVIGSAQRFGVPMGYGGPHAAFLSCHAEYKRLLPGRIIGVSRDAQGKPALRMAMQTREQHIRRDKATSNICTAQALLANIAGMYGVYHGPDGLTKIADRVHGFAGVFAAGAEKLGHKVLNSEAFFDTVTVEVGNAKAVSDAAVKMGMNIRIMNDTTVGVAMDETTTIEDINNLFAAFSANGSPGFTAEEIAPTVSQKLGDFARSSKFMQHQVFNSYKTEHELLRYLKKLENMDLSLAHSMIPLGSCTMKLNATSEMIPITWPELANLHPYVPLDQAEGYQEMFEDLASQLASITGFDAVSLQPNSGAAGEYAGLMAIRQYHMSRGDGHRDICIIPVSAHGTNPASAIMAGMKIIPVGVDAQGNINISEVREKAIQHKDNLAALMITYPSTHGVYEDGADEICNIIHENGGQVYMDGANMNAQVGLTAPGVIGADVCHLNLHKTFCIPHGGGGPGMGPIGVKAHLAPFMPTHPVIPTGAYPNFKSDKDSFGCMAAAPYGSSLILPISYAYISMMGSEGLKQASQLAILNANYMSKRLEDYYPVLFKGKNGTCAHEFIIDIRPITAATGIESEDIAKRLIDYGFHAPTMSWPVAGTLMIEPTESESKAELDRFCDALISIREEIRQIENGTLDKDNNPLKHAPHSLDVVTAEEWNRPYPRQLGAYPAPWIKPATKFWPTHSRVDNVYGDRHLVLRLPEDDAHVNEPEAAVA